MTDKEAVDEDLRRMRADLRRLIDDIVNVASDQTLSNEDVQKRREAILQDWAGTLMERGAEAERQKDMRHRRDYQQERDTEHLIMMSAVIASGISTTGTSAKSIAARALEIARAVLYQARQ